MMLPARPAGWMSRHGHLLRFGDDSTATCPESGLRYQRDGQRVRCLDLDEEAPLPKDLSVGARTYDAFKSGNGPTA